MKTKTTLLFTAILGGLAASYGVDSMTEQFAVTPTVEQKLYDKVYESAEFLQQISTELVDDLVGTAIEAGVDGGITGRAGLETDETKERQTKDPLGLDDREYRCYAVECDTHITWNRMDIWSKFPDFHTRFRNHVRQAIALDIIKIGWNGTSAAPITNIVTNPMLEDVNIGWLQLVRRDNAGNAIADGDQQAGEIRIGAYGDYENLDSAVHDLIQAIPLHKRMGLVAIIGDELLAKEKNKLYAKQAHTPSEKDKIELEQIIDTYGGLRAYKVPFFPGRGIVVTSFDNLCHYIQSGSTRASVENNAKKKRVEDYQSRNDCYYINDLEKIVFFEAASVKINSAKVQARVVDDTFDPENPDHWTWS
jgi:P2 family phage major capsid protein